MFDFRYHALSLVAVFVALVIGLLLGVAIGDRGLVSSAEKDVRQSLRSDVRRAQAEADAKQAEIDRHQDFEEQSYPALVQGRLSGFRIGLVALDTLSDRSVKLVRDSLEGSGGELTYVARVREPPATAEFADRAAGTRYDQLAKSPDLLQAFGYRMGVQLVSGGKLVHRERRPLMDLSGKLGQVDAIVLMRSGNPPSGESGDQANALEDGLVSGMKSTDVQVVGVETTEADPSQIPWYRGKELSSVDDIDTTSGQAALVYALAGADGTFGIKSTAEAQFPRGAG